MGRQALVSHASGKKHTKNLKDITGFFQPRIKTKPADSVSQSTSETSGKKQGTIDLLITNADTK